jgi:hypothetical protein
LSTGSGRWRFTRVLRSADRGIRPLRLHLRRRLQRRSLQRVPHSDVPVYFHPGWGSCVRCSSLSVIEQVVQPLPHMVNWTVNKKFKSLSSIYYGRKLMIPGSVNNSKKWTWAWTHFNCFFPTRQCKTIHFNHKF